MTCMDGSVADPCQPYVWRVLPTRCNDNGKEIASTIRRAQEVA